MAPHGAHTELPKLPALAIHRTSSAIGAGRRRQRSSAAATWPPPPVLAAEAANVYVVPVDTDKLASVRLMTENLKPGAAHNMLTFKPKRWAFHVEKPNWKSDIRWLSAADEHTFRGLFESLFDKLQIVSGGTSPLSWPAKLGMAQCQRISIAYS